MKLSVFFLYLLRVAEQEKITLNEALKYAVEIGYTAVDIDKDEIERYPEALELIRKNGLTVCNVYGEYDLLNGKHADACELIDYAVKSGSKVAMLLVGLFDKDELTEEMKRDGEKMKAFLNGSKKAARALTAIKKTAEYAKEKGVYLTIESFGSPHSLTSYISQIEWLLTHVEGLRFTFDIGNFYLNGQDIFAAYEKFAGKSVHVHCKDYLTTPAVGEKDFSYAKISVPVGQGAAPTEQIVKNFLQKGYEGCFTVEYLGVEGSAKVLKESAEYFKKISRGYEMKKVKIGILGCNYMGKMHADCYRFMENVQVVAVADLNEETANKLAKEHGAKVYTDASKLIEECELDALDICLPTFLHTQYAIKAMERGVKYVFIEKPVALNEEECDKLLQKQKETGVEIQIGQVIRFWDEYEYLKQLVDSKTYGEVVNATFRRISPSPTWSSNNWMKNSKLSGGAIVDLHIHDIDYMLYAFGEPQSHSHIKNTRGEYNSYITTICDYEDFVVSVEGTWYLPPSYPFNMYYRVVFEKAVAEYDRGKVTVYEAGGSFTPIIQKNELDQGAFEGGNISELNGYYNELKYFVEKIKNGEEIKKASLSDAVRSLKFILSSLR